MTRVDGSLARKLDFGEIAANGRTTAVSGRRPMLRLASAMRLTGPGKYQVLEARRRHAQITARRLLDLMDAQEHQPRRSASDAERT